MAFSRRGIPVTISGPTVAGTVTYPLTGKVVFTATAAAWTSNDILVDILSELDLDISTTTVTTNIIYVVKRKGADGIYYPIATSATHTDQGKTISLSLGSGTVQGAGGTGVADAATGNTNWSAPYPFGDLIQIVLTPTGAFTGTLSLKGK